MVTLYPYTLWALLTGPLTVDDNGNPVQTDTVWQSVAACRDEQNTAGQTVQLADSSMVVPAAVVYLPNTPLTLGRGTPIEVRDGDTVRLAGAVVRFERNQLHTRIWV